MAIDTLLYQIQNGAFDVANKRVVFINASFHSDLSCFKSSELVLQQYFKPYVDVLENAGFSTCADIPDDDGSYDIALLLLPKNMVEARYLIARASQLLGAGGTLICAADNKAGGTRIKKMMHNFGFSDLSEDSRNKSRSVSGVADDLNAGEISKAIAAGESQKILGGKFISRAGIFGWDKIDKGSSILTDYLPKNLKGRGADFGCGYGYLSEFVLSNCPKVKHLICADADYRAVNACRINLSDFECEQEFLWCDLTKPQSELKNLDFIIMNPPFHEGKKLDKAIGSAFIGMAYQSLRRGGGLYMVANSHLAYENILGELFPKSSKLYEGQGFKVLHSVKL